MPTTPGQKRGRPARPQHGRGRPHRQEKPAPDRSAPELGPDGLPQVQLLRRGVERWQGGHPWIYRADLNGDPGLPGEVVRVTDGRGWFIGKAFYSKHS
jgi:23S rRNA (cytosine1962-C5)-methyltransferase